MSEYATQVGIARARAGLEPSEPPDEARVRAILASIADPEIPAVSIVDLGMIQDVTVGPDGIRVTILPTFVGCPALDVIRAAIARELAVLGRPVAVVPSFDPPWTSDRITSAGRAALASAGISPPADPADVACPYCASRQVVMDAAFGPTLCRSLWYCRTCRQPFEALKPV